MAAPTVNYIRSKSKVPFDDLEFETPTGANEDPLQEELDAALGTFRRWTGQFWDDSGRYSDASPAQGSEALARKAIRWLVEVSVYKDQEDRLESFQDWDLLTSFNVSGYSENRRSGKDFKEATDALLGAILRPIMDQDHLDEWDAALSGRILPAFAVTEVGWGGQSAGYEDDYETQGLYDTDTNTWTY